MSFAESPRFPESISLGATGGPGFEVDIVATISGFEKRNLTSPVPRARYEVAHGLKTQAELDLLVAFWRAMEGPTTGFRFKDWSDFTVALTNGVLGTGNGTGLPSYQLGKRYTAGSINRTRLIRKPVAGTVAVRRNGSPVTIGLAPGNVGIDTTTGVATFVADATSPATSITVGTTTTVVLTTNPGTLVAGQLLHLSGFVGTGAALVNGLAHTINSVSGTGPFTFVLATNTAGATISAPGTGSRFPQVADALTWAGEFDVPVRFVNDQMRVSIEQFNAYSWGQIQLIEVRV